MKFDPGQRKVYIIAIAVIVAAIAILCIWFLYLKDGDEKTPAAVDETPMPSHEISAISGSTASRNSSHDDVDEPWCPILSTSHLNSDAGK